MRLILLLMSRRHPIYTLTDTCLPNTSIFRYKTWAVIQEAVNNVARTSSAEIDVLKLPITDPKTYELYASGETTAVFQMESPGMQHASRDLKPEDRKSTRLNSSH